MDGGCPIMAQVKMQSNSPELQAPIENGKFGIALYRDAIECVGPLRQTSMKERGFEAVYYRRMQTLAHVYGYGDSPAEARQAAERLYSELQAEAVVLGAGGA